MQTIRNSGMILLGVWLILTGLLPLLKVPIPAKEVIDIVLSLLAMAAGVLILLWPVQLTRSLGVILFCIWLILTGLLPLLTVAIPASDIVLSLLAIAAGILILVGR